MIHDEPFRFFCFMFEILFDDVLVSGCGLVTLHIFEPALIAIYFYFFFLLIEKARITQYC